MGGGLKIYEFTASPINIVSYKKNTEEFNYQLSYS